MVELFCALVGVAGSIFSVDVEASASIARVKEAIMRKKESKLRGAQCCDADELQLFFAVAKDERDADEGTNNRTWLASRDRDVVMLKRGMEIPQTIAELMGDVGNALDETATLAESIEEANLPLPSSRQLHLLVALSQKQQQQHVDDEDAINQHGEDELSTSNYSNSSNSCTSVSSDDDDEEEEEEEDSEEELIAISSNNKSSSSNNKSSSSNNKSSSSSNNIASSSAVAWNMKVPAWRAYEDVLDRYDDDDDVHLNDGKHRELDAQFEKYWKPWKASLRATVCIASQSVSSGTALVVDRTPTHVYLLTCLQLWSGSDTVGCIAHLSVQFQREVRRYVKIRTQEVQTPTKTNAKRKRDTVDDQRKPQLSSASMGDKPNVVLHLRVNDKMVKLCRFSLSSDICWRSSADSDFAIFKIATPTTAAAHAKLPLVKWEISTDVTPRRYVDVYGFQGALGEPQRSRDCGTYIPHVIITRIDGNQMTLVTGVSNPALSPSAVICSQDNVALGYLGEAFREVKPGMFQAIAYTLHGIPRDLPSYLAGHKGKAKDD